MKIGAFGHGLPLGLFASMGLGVTDVTGVETRGPSPADDFIEPFMDPFAASLLRRLATGALDGFEALIFLRESPGAVHAFHYAEEFARRGVLTAQTPKRVLFNLIAARGDAAEAFNRAECARVAEELGPFAQDGPVGAPDFSALDSKRAGAMRLALLGAPLGNARLQDLLERAGVLVFDQQRADAAAAASGADLDAALAAYAGNPFAARQEAYVYVGAVEAALQERRVGRVVWQVDTHDDLWGWLMPQVREMCGGIGVAFTDLGFLPRWPGPRDLAPVARLLGLEEGP